MEESLTRFRYHDIIVLGDLSANIVQAQNPCSQQVANLLMDFRLMELLLHFRQRRRYRQMKTWSLMIQGRAMQARSYYIMGTDWRHFKMVGIRGVSNYPSEHLVLQSRLLIYPNKEGHQYDAGVPRIQMGNVRRCSKDTRIYQT